MTTVSRVVLLLFLLLPAVVLARVKTPLPEPDMLEFLGSFETARGKPIDPMVFANQEKGKSKGEAESRGRGLQTRRSQQEKREQKDRTDDK